MSDCPSVKLSDCPVRQSDCPSVLMSECPSVLFDYLYVQLSYLNDLLSVRPAFRLSSCMTVRHASCPSVRLSVCPSVRLSVCPSVRLSVCPSVRLSVCPSVQLSVWWLWCPGDMILTSFNNLPGIKKKKSNKVFERLGEKLWYNMMFIMCPIYYI